MTNEIIDVDVEENLPVEIKENTTELVDELERDFKKAQENIQKLMDVGFESIETMQMILQESQHPRSAEVLTGTLAALSSMSKDLVALHESRYKIKQGIKEDSGEPSGGINTQNNIFVGSSQELQKLLKGQNE